MKRTCIKSLPSVLVIHLMRFGFDWESGRSIKYDEQIRVTYFFFLGFLITIITVLPLLFPFYIFKFHLKCERLWSQHSEKCTAPRLKQLVLVVPADL